jgi:hypothetical protein
MEKDFDQWNSLKKQLNENERIFYAHPREIWWCSLGINIGAEIDDDKASLVIDLVVETGRGYRTIEESTVKKQSDFVALDTIFSPVVRCRYKVDKTRVGFAEFTKLPPDPLTTLHCPIPIAGVFPASVVEVSPHIEAPV